MIEWPSLIGALVCSVCKEPWSTHPLGEVGPLWCPLGSRVGWAMGKKNHDPGDEDRDSLELPLAEARALWRAHHGMEPTW